MAAGDNLALNSLGITPSASSTYSPGSGYDPLYAFDALAGSAGHRWNSNLETPNGCWLQCDFGSAKYIDKFRLYQFGSGYQYASAFKIQSSNDGSSWTDRHTVSSVSSLDTGQVSLTT